VSNIAHPRHDVLQLALKKIVIIDSTFCILITIVCFHTSIKLDIEQIISYNY